MLRTPRFHVLAVATALAACTDPAGMMVAKETGGATVVEDRVIVDVERPYPIQILWWECQSWWSCPRDGRQIDPRTLRRSVVAGIEIAVAEWADALAPTPVRRLVIPPGRDGAPLFWTCAGFERKTGDTLQAGLLLNVIVEPGSGAGGGPCGEGAIWDRPDVGPVPEGIIRLGRDFYSSNDYRDWRFFGLHEMGHILGVGTSARWRHSFRMAPDSAAAWVTYRAAVATFDRIGGKDYPGRKVPVDHDYCQCHWHPCVARGDVMADVWDRASVITDLTASVLFPGFHVHRQQVELPANGPADDAWAQCPELSSTAPASPRARTLFDSLLVRR